ncbi:protoporphyrinogen oxidase [Chitinophaga silvatica]|uniref:Coproporphyrinogen III oxidase n=1 Tax=Chitinophaga silvatica TaxID=2282649 RepID=A0A3E1Y4Y9_9BACT|nr:protoporphyrinogen oxidase [Chitinophaga silvatica]RFS19741.1 protoporphyrinogen oxidase [Chitinophaga silvatica]
MSEQPILIIGAGISGLSIAYHLQQQNIPYLLLEASSRAGGVMTSYHDQGFEMDAGANTIAASPEVLQFFDELGLSEYLLQASAASKNRFLVRNGQLHAVSPHPFKIISSPYLSRQSKWRLFTERFRKPLPGISEETVTTFVSRRFNKEIADYVFDPVLSGIYAGNPDKLSIKEVLPALPKWEETYGSVTKGLMKNKGAMGGRKIISFKGGNQILTDRMASRLSTPVRLNSEVTAISKGAEGYDVQVLEQGNPTTIKASQVVFTTPAYITANVVKSLDAQLSKQLSAIHYPKMGVLHVGFEASAIPQPVEGFGFLVPNAENLHFLGAICNSAIFPEKAPEGKVLFTIFTGGARQEQLLDQMGAEALQNKIIEEVSQLLKITAAPTLKYFRRWDKAIPQLNVGFGEVRTAVDQFEKKYPGIFISGNYLQGVAIPALLQYGKTFAAQLRKK